MYKHKLYLVIFILLFSQFLSFNTSNNQQSTNFLTHSFSSSTLDDNTVAIADHSGTENVRVNILRNGGFEEEDARYGPQYFSYSVYTNGYANSSYQDDVHSGSYAGYIGAQGTPQQSATYYNTRVLLNPIANAYIDQIIYLNFWFKNKAIPDITHGARTYLRLQIQTSGGNRFLNYYFSALGLPSNSTYSYHFNLDQPIGSWYNVQRNITSDCEQAFGSFDSSWYMHLMFFYAQSVINATGETILLFDDVSITNSTSYEFLQVNGDFELGDGSEWDNFRYSPGYSYLTSVDYTEGSSALNLTANSRYNTATSYASLTYSTYFTWLTEPKGYYPSQPDNLNINFDWKISSTEGSALYQYAIFYFLMQNSTYTSYLEYVLDVNYESIPYSNSTCETSSCYFFKPTGFREDNVWHHFSIDVYTLLEALNLTNLVIMEIDFVLHTLEDAESKIQLLVDALEIITYPIGDPSFEECLYSESYDPIQTWICPFTDTYTNLSTDAHSGTYTANITAHTAAGYRYIYRPMYLAVQDNLHTDFWWKLNYLSSEPGTYTFILFTIDDSYSLYYVLGTCANTIFTNNSQTCYYYVENFNQTGVWNNIFRNFSNDVATAFGSGNWNITRIDLIANTGSALAKVSTLFDDLHFVRDIAPPEITGFGLDPALPQYSDSVEVAVEVSDNFGVQSVELHYKLGSESWTTLPMVENVTEYIQLIPQAAWNTLVQYYIVATDVHGIVATYGSLSNPLSYLVDDNIHPILSVEGPDPYVNEHKDLEFNITGYDEGSGISSFTIEDENGTLYEGATVPTTFTWETADFPNGDYVITFILYDNAGNFDELNAYYTINIPTPSTTTTTKQGGLPISLAILLFCFIFISIIVRRKKA